MSAEQGAAVVVERSADVQARIGERLGASGWLTVGQAAIDAFAEVTGDEQWIHVDRDRAAASPFGTTIAHGYLVLALTSAFLQEVVDLSRLGMILNYGLDRVRFTSPVPSGGRVRGVVHVDAAEELRGGLQVVWRVVVELEGQEKPACVAHAIHRLYD